MKKTNKKTGKSKGFCLKQIGMLSEKSQLSITTLCMAFLFGMVVSVHTKEEANQNLTVAEIEETVAEIPIPNVSMIKKEIPHIHTSFEMFLKAESGSFNFADTELSEPEHTMAEEAWTERARTEQVENEPESAGMEQIETESESARMEQVETKTTVLEETETTTEIGNAEDTIEESTILVAPTVCESDTSVTYHIPKTYIAVIEVALSEEEETQSTLKEEERQYRGFKSYESYTALTCKTSYQYRLQRYGVTTDNGLRVVNNRYCVALGSYFGAEIGQYFDLILENGTVIPCIKGDEKADIHTDSNHIFTMHSACCSEFLVDTDVISDRIRFTGNASDFYPEWNSPVACVVVSSTRVVWD